MNTLRLRWTKALPGCFVALFLLACTPTTDTTADHDQPAGWVTAWASSPSPFLPGGHTAYLEPFADVTIRQVLRVDAAGNEIRIRFTNELGRDALRIGAASVGRLAGDGTMPSDIVSLTFGAEPGVVIPPGATPGEHMSWPSQLSRRLAGSVTGSDWVVVNAGISGNRVLHDGGSQNGLARFDRDALSIAGVTDIVLLEGVNDLGVGFAPGESRDEVDAEDLILAFRQMIEQAHLRGARIYGATILPYAGAVYYAPAGDAERIKVNDWIRDSGAFDGVVDLDAVMRDPNDPGRGIPG